MARELARLYADKGIVSTSVNPGNLRTELQRHVTPLQDRIIVWPLTYYSAPSDAFAY